jgi:hypothetical protein
MSFLDLADHTDAVGAVAESDHEHVIFSPPRVSQARLEQALRAAVRHGHKRLRVIVRGARLQRSALPKDLLAAAKTNGCLLTELDAYLPTERAPLVGELSEACRAFLRETYRVPGFDAADVLWGSAMQRTLTEAYSAWLYVIGLSHFHKGDTIHCLDRHWPGLAALHAHTEGRVEPPPPRVGIARHASRTAALLLIEALGLVAARAKEHGEARPILRALRALPRIPVQRWATVIANAPRASRHAIAALGDARAGLLLLAPLRAQPAPHEPAPEQDAIVPALANVRDHSVEQAAVIERTAALALTTARTLVCALPAALSIARRGSHLQLGPLALPLTPQRVRQLLRVSTFDCLRAREAAVATERICQRHAMAGAKIVFPHASLAAACAVDLVLQRHGAETFELVHGALADPIDMVTHARSLSTVKILWTRAEAEMHAAYLGNQRVAAGVMPAFTPIVRTKKSAKQPRILVLSNYAHPILGFDGPHPREAYQRLLWRAVLEATDGVRCAIVWRPHPGDDRGAVERMHAELPKVKRSTGTLDHDLAAADVVIATISTTVVEALRARDAALFVHDIPFHERDVLMRVFDRKRTFANGDELRRKLSLHLAEPSFAPEQALRRRFFGKRAVPHSAESVLG